MCSKRSERMAGTGFARVNHVENFRSFAVYRRGERNIRTARKSGTDRKPERFDFFRGDTFSRSTPAVGVGNNKKVAGRVKPCRADRDRVGDHCHKSKGASPSREKAPRSDGCKPDRWRQRRQDCSCVKSLRAHSVSFASSEFAARKVLDYRKTAKTRDQRAGATERCSGRPFSSPR